MPEGLVLLTHQYYAEGPAGAPHVSLPKLLRNSQQLSPLLERLAQYSRTYRLPYRITEANSVYDEGHCRIEIGGIVCCNDAVEPLL